MPGPIQGVFPNIATLPELTGNSQFTVLNGVLWLIGETQNSDSDFAIYYSLDYGISFTQALEYSFPTPNLSAFDPAVCNDGTLVHFIGTTLFQNAGSPPITSVVKFTLNPGVSPTPSLSGPFPITTNEEVEADYDIVALNNGHTYAVLGVITPDAADALNGYEINSSGAVISTTTITSSPSRMGQTFGAVSLVVGAAAGFTYTTIFTDTFQRPNEQPLNPTNWTVVTTFNDPLAVVNDVCVSSTNADFFGQEVYTGLSVPANQYAEVVVAAYNNNLVNSGSGIGVFIRGSATNDLAGYTFEVTVNGDGTSTLGAATGNVFVHTQIIPTVNIGDVLRIEAFGSQLTAYYNGVLFYTWTDATYTSGVPGVLIDYDNVQTDTAISEFQTGSITTGQDLELYYTQHPKRLTFADMSVQIGLAIGSGSPISWGGTTIINTIVCRQASPKLTVIAYTAGSPATSQRLLSWAYYTQNRSGLSGNSLLGYLPSSAQQPLGWTWNELLGTPTASIIEPTFTVNIDGSIELAYIVKVLASPSDGAINVFILNPTTFTLTVQANFRNSPRASWLRGTKDVLPIAGSPPMDVFWAFIADSANGTSQFYSGFSVPPIAVITPIALTAYRNNTYTFNASQSYDLNFNPMQYEWTISYNSWQANHVYSPGNQIVDSNNNVQVVTFGGTSGAATPTFNQTLFGNTSDNSVVWQNTGTVSGITLIPEFPPLSTSTTAQLFIPDSVGPSAISITISVGVVDINPSGNPIHIPPTGTAIATSAVTVPFVAAPTIIWLSNPILAARNSLVTLSPIITVDSHTFPTYSYVQIFGTNVSPGGTLPTLTFNTAGVNVNGEALMFQLTVNDGVNPPVSSIITVDVNAYNFAQFDTLRLSRSNFVVTGSPATLATISQRNTVQTWTPLQESALYTDLTNFRRSTTILGDDRFVSISDASVLVFQYVSNTSYVLLRRLLVPTSNAGVNIIDAWHTEQDYTLVLTDSGVLYRYSSAPLINTDDPDVTIDLSSLTTFTFNRILATPTFANIKVLLLTGDQGTMLLQVDSTTLEIQGLLIITKESNLLYGGDNTQFIRWSNVESIHTGKVLVGSLDDFGATFETLIDMTRRIVIGTWDKSKLKNQIVTSGEILFEPFSGYVGLPPAPFLEPIITNSNYAAFLTWTQQRPDLVSSYVISLSINSGPFNDYATVGSGLIFNYITPPLNEADTYAFEVRAVTPDGDSPESNIQVLLAPTQTPSAILSILSISTNFQSPQIIQSAQANFSGVSSDSITLTNPAQAGNMIVFAQTFNGVTPNITDNNGATYTNVEGLLYTTVNLVTGSLTISYGPPSGSPAANHFVTGPVFLFEIANSNVPFNGSTSEVSGSGTTFGIQYSNSTVNGMEILHVLTGGVLASNPFSSLMGNANTTQGNFFNLGQVGQGYPGWYTNTFSQIGTGTYQVVAVNVDASVNGVANLTWTQAHEENVVGYLVQQKINAGSFATVATINNPSTTSFAVPLTPVLLNSGVVSTTFTYQIISVLTNGLGDTSPSNQVSVQFPIQASAIEIVMPVGVPFSLNLISAGIVFSAGNLPYTFNLLSGPLPPSFTLSSAGVLSGTPPTVATYPCMFQITDNLGVAIDIAVLITVMGYPEYFEINSMGNFGTIYSINDIII